MASVSCLFAVELDVRAPHRCDWHTHTCTEIVLYRQCTGRLLQDGVESRYADGDLSIYQPHMRHADRCETSGFQFCLGVQGCGAEKLPPGLFAMPAGLEDVCQPLRRELHTADELRGARLDLLAGWLVLRLRQAHLGQTVPSAVPDTDGELPALVRSAKEIFDTQYSGGVRVGEVADTLFISPDYLRQLFRSTLGESPIGYLLRRRMEAARELLAMSEANVAEVGLAVGFESAYYFCHAFKKHTGLTPTQYRRQHRAALP